MDTIFGIPMNGILLVLAVLLASTLLVIGWIAWRRPVIFRLGVRNIPRRRAQTILILVGLMLSTTITTAALGTGDTIAYSATAATYQLLGHADEVVVSSQEPDGRAATALTTGIPASTLPLVEQALAGDARVAGIMPMLFATVPVVNERAGQSEPRVVVAGIDPARLGPFGGLKDAHGGAIDLAATAADEIVVSEKTASQLVLAPGDALTLFYGNQPVSLRVAAVAQDSLLSGVLQSGGLGMVLPLDRLERMTRQDGVLSLIAIANAGGVRGGLVHTDGIVDRLKPALAGKQLGVDPIKQGSVRDAQTAARTFTDIFLLMGLFSIAAGILLIVLIFAMLAAERRSEMGMERAVGIGRGQLIQQFVSEGVVYTLAAGLVGTGLGLLAAFSITTVMSSLYAKSLPITAHVEPRSLVVAYCLGVVITFGAVVVAAWRVSRLSVVAALRDLPEPSSPRRQRRAVVLGILFLVLGALFILAGQRTDQAFPFYTGLSLLPFGVAMVLRFIGVPGRPVYTGVSLLLLALWLMPGSIAGRILPEHKQGMEMFFLSGLFLVLAATLLILQNTDLILAGISRLGAVVRGALPALRIGVAYPGAARARTGLTIAMFCLIVFSLVMMATMNQNVVNLFLGDEAAAGWDVRVDVASANPITDFTGTLRAAGVDTSGITSVGIATTPDPSARVRTPGGSWRTSLVHGMDASFINHSALTFRQRAAGYPTDAAIIHALLTQPGVAVIDASAVPNPGNLGGNPDLFQLPGVAWEDTSFAPATVEVPVPGRATPARLTIIGVIDPKIGSLFGLYANQTTVQSIFPTLATTSYFVALHDHQQAAPLAHEIERALLAHGVQGTSIRDELADMQQQSRTMLNLMEGFMALGLLIGVAAVGVIAFRTVVERRQQIGVLRAIGFSRSMVAASFLIETGFIVGAGVLTGAMLGIWLGRNVFTSDQWGSSTAAYTVPWGLILIIVGATIVAAEAMAWLPARRAARVMPAEALRYE